MALLKQWVLVEYTFRTVLGVDLEEVRHVRSWRWFRVMVTGLLSGDNLLARHFNPRAEG